MLPALTAQQLRLGHQSGERGGLEYDTDTQPQGSSPHGLLMKGTSAANRPSE